MFPPAVRPKPCFGLGDNVAFQASGMQLCNLSVCSSSRVFHQQLYMYLVTAPFYFFDESINDWAVQLAGNPLGAQKDRCILIEKGHPVGVGWVWCLIGDKRCDGQLVAHSRHLFKCIPHGDELSAKACAHLINQAVRIFIGKRMIDHVELGIDLGAAGIAGPFPVALVPHNQDKAFALGRKLVEQGFRAWFEITMFQHTALADRQGLKRFQEKVTKMPVEFFPDNQQFLF